MAGDPLSSMNNYFDGISAHCSLADYSITNRSIGFGPLVAMGETLKRKVNGGDKPMEDGAQKGRARRASRPKVKTGCNNCKYVEASAKEQ